MPSEAYVRLVGAIPQRPHMEQVVAKFQKNFLESETRRARREAAVAQVRQQLAQQDKIKTEVERAVPTIRQMAQVLANQKPNMPTINVKVQERLTTGSIGITRVPPYDWPWTWNSINGDAVADENADQNAGTMSCFENNGNSGGGSAGAAAVGFYFRPPLPGVGIITVDATPAFNYLWWTYNVFDSSHSDA
jgi:hypothetical protein